MASGGGMMWCGRCLQNTVVAVQARGLLNFLSVAQQVQFTWHRYWCRVFLPSKQYTRGRKGHRIQQSLLATRPTQGLPWLGLLEEPTRRAGCTLPSAPFSFITSASNLSSRGNYILTRTTGYTFLTSVLRITRVSSCARSMLLLLPQGSSSALPRSSFLFTSHPLCSTSRAS